jgi:hypothetical protein
MDTFAWPATNPALPFTVEHIDVDHIDLIGPDVEPADGPPSMSDLLPAGDWAVEDVEWNMDNDITVFHLVRSAA